MFIDIINWERLFRVTMVASVGGLCYTMLPEDADFSLLNSLRSPGNLDGNLGKVPLLLHLLERILESL